MFPKRALRTQLRYFRRFMRKPADMPVRKYFTRGEEIHGRIGEFPAEGTLPRELTEEERLDVYDRI